MLLPQAKCCHGRTLKLSDPSQSSFASWCPIRPRVEQDVVDRVNLLLIMLCISSCKIPTRTPRLVERVRIRGYCFAVRRLVVLVGFKIFPYWHNSSRMSISFWIFWFWYAEREICMHGIFIYFYTTTVNVLTGFYTPRKLLTWGFKILWYNNKLFYFRLLTQC